ncbi:hypothetical protein FRC02_010398 [Tulasnella sp. 418]|nr:hypothetical protein FRC02_010398 [Tulasnella sp. 418]
MSTTTNAYADTIHLPQVTLQHDIQTVIDDVRQGITSEGEDVWISCYLNGRPSVHGKAKISPASEGEVSIEGREGVQLKRIGGGVYSAACPSLDIGETILKSPKATLGEVKSQQIPKAIHSFDISPNNKLYATGHEDGSIVVSPITSTPGAPTTPTSRPHLSTILSLKFFPSSEVILASSLDMSLSIISAIDLSVPRQLKGHSRAVTDTAIIEKGRNVLSSGRDGAVRLWDVGSGKSIRLMPVETFSPVLKISLGETTPDLPSPSPPEGATEASMDAHQAPSGLDPREVGTNDKVVCCAMQNGRFTILDLRSKRTSFTSSNSPPSAGKLSALHSIAYAPSHQLIGTGSLDGVVTMYDTRSLSNGPLYSFRRNGACIEDLAFISTSSPNSTAELVVATEDGLPYKVRVGPENPEVVEEYVGNDCDAVRVVKVGADGAIWTAGDDGVVRRY